MKNLQIRRTEPADASGIKDLFETHAAYSQTLQLPHPSTKLWADRLADIPEAVHSFVAVYEDELIGNIGLTLIQRPRRNHTASLGMAVKQGFTGSGVGTALLDTVIELSDNWLNLRRLELTVFTDNEAAIALYRKYKFEIEGEAREFAFRNGQYVNAYYMARLK